MAEGTEWNELFTQGMEALMDPERRHAQTFSQPGLDVKGVNNAALGIPSGLIQTNEPEGENDEKEKGDEND